MKQKIGYILIVVVGLYIASIYPYRQMTEKLDALKVDITVGRDLVRHSKYKSNHEELNKQDTGKQIKLYAKSALLLDGSSNRILYQKDGLKTMPMASTTKIMTCIVALENGNMDDMVEFSAKAAGMPDVQLNAPKGSKFKLGDLLYSLMLESHNDTAVAVAEHIGGSVEGFAAMMNAKAKELGCNDTSFVTPNGLDADGHYTTAYDLARIASYAIKNPDFIKITNTPSWTFNEQTTNSQYAVSNKNRFLCLMEGAIGVKTGFTNGAGYCFVGAVQRDGKTLISVVLGSGWPPNKTYKWTDTTNLMNYGLKEFQVKDIFDYTVQFNPMPVLKGKTQEVGLKMTGSIPLLMSENDLVTVSYELPTYLDSPVASDVAVGKATYFVNGQQVAQIPIFTDGTVESITWEYCFDQVLDLFFM